MRFKSYAFVALFIVTALVVPVQTYAYESPAILEFGLSAFPRMLDVLGRPYQTALKYNDNIGRTAFYIKSTNEEPKIFVDLSELGIPNASTTQNNWRFWGPMFYQGHYPSYLFALYHMRVGNVAQDGIKTISVTATDELGIVATSTARVIVDNIEPIFNIEKIEFSKLSPKKGDTMYISGIADGTGSEIKVAEIFGTVWDADKNPIPRLGSGTPYSQSTEDFFNDVLSKSENGRFERIPITILDSRLNYMDRASYLQLEITAHDASGHVIRNKFMVPIPKEEKCVTDCISNVMFLPGIQASRLYRPDYNGGTDKLWEPNIDSDVQDLYMDEDGTSKRFDVYAKDRDVLDEIPSGKNIYKSFINKMNDLKNGGIIVEWTPIAYDWRLSLDDILNYGHNIDGRIYYSGDLRATSTPYIIQELRHLAETSKTGKVSVVAHSNGGLLAKRLTEILGPEESAKLIDKMIFVAVPQAGTPVAIPATMHGYKQDILYGLISTKSTARTFAQNAPMAYNLMPSAKYFTYVDDPVVEFDSSLTDWIARYGSTIHSQERLQTFLEDSFGKVDPRTGDINSPIQANDLLISKSKTLHDTVDDWSPPTGIKVIQIAGWGIPKTVVGIKYKKHSTGVKPYADFTIDGDGTVVVPSALLTSTSTAVENYWMDLKKYGNDHWVPSLLGFATFDHSRILESEAVLDFIADKITNITKSISDYIYISKDSPSSLDKRLRYSLHSPLTLSLYDAAGRHTGVSTSTGQIEEQIPGTYYTELGDSKYIFSDASTTMRILMDGYDTGTFTLNIDQYVSDVRMASTTFKDIPTTPQTKVALDVQSDISTLSKMRIDIDGDGTVDAALTPRLDATVTSDVTPPEIRFGFSTTTKSVIFVGIDDTSSTTMSTRSSYVNPNVGDSTTTVSAVDESGNTTELAYSGYHFSSGSDTVTPLTIVYNGAASTTEGSSAIYKWKTNKLGKFTMLVSRLTSASTTVETTYNRKNNSTTITRMLVSDSNNEASSDTQLVKQTLPGMVIQYISTRNGSLIINY